jgi:hypothetical protein
MAFFMFVRKPFFGGQSHILSKKMAEHHEKKEVDAKIAELRAVGEALRPTLPFKVTVTRVADDAPFDSEV